MWWQCTGRTVIIFIFLSSLVLSSILTFYILESSKMNALRRYSESSHYTADTAMHDRQPTRVGNLYSTSRCPPHI